MSTWLYLECRTHDPVLSADGESGQHTYDLPQIRTDIANRDLIVQARDADLLDVSDDHFRGNTVRFLAAHPKCDIGIRDEYGHDHPITEEQP